MGNQIRKTVHINEQELLDMMVGEIPVLSKRIYPTDKEDNTPEISQETPLEEKQREPEKKETNPEKKETGVVKHYESIFLKQKTPVKRATVRIDQEIYDTLSDLLPVMAPKLAFGNYLNNILREHLDQNKEVINELYKKKLKKRRL